MPEGPQESLRRIYRQAVASLPPITRDIFLAHRVDGDDLAVIAVRHALPVKNVAGHLADALVAIDRALRATGH